MNRDKQSDVRRIVWALDFQEFTNEHLNVLKMLENEFDELIIVITRADEAYSSEMPFSAGERMERITWILRNKFSKPFYVLVLKQCGLTKIQAIQRIKILAPAFDTYLCTNQEDEILCSKILTCHIQTVDMKFEEKTEYPDVISPVKRGVFVTRAQFFHNGHAAHIRKMADEVDEIIVVVAMANVSHTMENPATAGERIEMIKPFLDKLIPQRYYLTGVPYDSFDAANFDELKLLFPCFQSVYSNSPGVAALAETAGLKTIEITEKIETSATMIRKKIVMGEPFEHLMPKEVFNVLLSSPALIRLKKLSQPEQRGQGRY